MLFLINNLSLPPDKNEADLLPLIREQYNLSSFNLVRILRKSLDARKKDAICYKYNVIIETDNGTELHKHEEISVWEEKPEMPEFQSAKKLKVIIAGAGPAGLFCALRLAEAGAQVTILERGKAAPERLDDILSLENHGILSTESNVLFGEGGAGFYSDGKLTARTRSIESNWLFRTLIECGAAPDIACLAKPHIGTDRLKEILPVMRKRITDMSSQVIFSSKVTSLIIKDGRCIGVETSDGKEYLADAVVLATGHSARDTYQMLAHKNVMMEKKDFAAGLRIEHPAELIREIQYGKSKYAPILPAAEYFLSMADDASGRGTYSFCMCPGGFVVNASSEKGMLNLNGMSYSARDGKFSNAALVVSVKTSDCQSGALGGIDFQRGIERAAFHASNGTAAPAQRLTSFMKNKIDSSLPECSYTAGVTPHNIRNYMPRFIHESIAAAIPVFERKMRGFLSSEALLIGAETRTSSPVRILRDKYHQSLSHPGLFPTGEGAGYAGGIVSSAVDGIRTADFILQSLL
ncbi:MAG: NAD(P)/FAD-dependent oxidoreductase [Leptospirales bacterium]|nr:NAD(P)/FAD-dependent oxidoreductase [Leptospirales bacterium]